MNNVHEAIVKGRSSFDVERTGIDCNSENAGEVGRSLRKPGCEAGECLFISIECAKSKIMGEVIERLSKYVEKKVDAEQVFLHVDALESWFPARFACGPSLIEFPDEADRAAGHQNPSRKTSRHGRLDPFEDKL